MKIPVGRNFFFGVVIAVLLIAFLLAARLFIINAVLTNPLTAFYNNSAYQKDLVLEDFPVYEQSYANSCGLTTISMAYSYLIEPISEQDMADQLSYALGKSGMLPAKFYQTLDTALKDEGFKVEHQANVTDADFLERTYLQLQQGIPVPIYFSTVNDWDKPNYDTHYSLIIGIRPAQKEVIIANAYGFLEEMTISELLSAMKYENFRNAPFDFRAGLFASVINKNNFYGIQK